MDHWARCRVAARCLKSERRGKLASGLVASTGWSSAVACGTAVAHTRRTSSKRFTHTFDCSGSGGVHTWTFVATKSV